MYSERKQTLVEMICNIKMASQVSFFSLVVLDAGDLNFNVPCESKNVKNKLFKTV